MVFNGTRLRDVRELFNLSQNDLEDRLNLPDKTILKYENGIEEPSFKVQVQINNFFALRMTFFNKKDSVTRVTNYNEISFDPKYLDELKSKERELQFVNMSDNFLNEVFKYLNIVKTSIMDVLKEVQSMKDKSVDIDEIADRVRDDLGIDKKNGDIMAAIEKSGVFVLERGLNKHIGSYSTWTDTNRPYIILKTNRYGSDRLFDLAHEFGHLLLHRGNDFSSFDVDYLKKLEREANQFANSFLLEKDFFIKNFQRTIKDPSNPDQYLFLKKYYGTSIVPIEKRARKLGLLNQTQSKEFYRVLKSLGYDKHEPYDLDVPFYIPGKIYTILNALSADELNDIYNTFGINEEFLYKVFLRKIEELHKDEKIKTARIIPMKSIKKRSSK